MLFRTSYKELFSSDFFFPPRVSLSEVDGPRKIIFNLLARLLILVDP